MTTPEQIFELSEKQAQLLLQKHNVAVDPIDTRPYAEIVTAMGIATQSTTLIEQSSVDAVE